MRSTFILFCVLFSVFQAVGNGISFKDINKKPCRETSDCPGHADCEESVCVCQPGFWTLQLDKPCEYEQRSKKVVGNLSIWFGWLGADRFYMGFTGLGLGKLGLFATNILASIYGPLLYCSGASHPLDLEMACSVRIKENLGMVTVFRSFAGFVAGAVWWIVDIAMLSRCDVRDVNGVPILSDSESQFCKGRGHTP